MRHGAHELPAGSADCHVHVYGPYDRFPAVSGGKFSPLQATPVEALLALWDGMGIARGVIVHALAAGAETR
jgi:predicted TIM-barrel fold metal-dependent hydrolase